MIKQIAATKDLPWELLLLADPDRSKVLEYVLLSHVYGYFVNNQIVGVIVLKQLSKSNFEIMNLAVDENYQQQGIGKQLVIFVEDYLKNMMKGRTILYVRTGSLPSPALTLYQKCGFTIVETKENYFVKNYSKPIFENGVQLRHQVILTKILEG